MKKTECNEFGKMYDDTYKIIERKYKDNSVYFFIEVTETSNVIEMMIPHKYLLKERFDSYDKALNIVNDLKEEDKKITVLEETIHII